MAVVRDVLRRHEFDLPVPRITRAAARGISFPIVLSVRAIFSFINRTVVVSLWFVVCIGTCNVMRDADDVFLLNS